MVCLQKTKVQSVSCSFLKSFAGSFLDKRQCIGANGASGGLITCWSSNFFDCTDVIVRTFSLTVRLTHRASGVVFYVSNVYGPHSREEKRACCTELALLQHCCGDNWVVCGDFNLIRTPEDRNRGGRDGCGARLFNDLISELALIDLPLLNQRFTWSNMQRCPVLAKLDRFLVSTGWDATFPLTEVEALPRTTSDHCPILLSSDGKKIRRRSPFRFEEVWLKNEDFVKRVPQWWQEVEGGKSGVLDFTAKLRHCRTMIKRWCASHFYSIRGEKNRIATEINELDRLEERQALTSEKFEYRQVLKDRLTKVLTDEEILWKTRAKQRWLKEGDGNTKFFHAYANGRKRSNQIGVVKEDGRVFSKEADKKQYFARWFKDLFSPPDNGTSSFGDWSHLFRQRRLSDDERGMLIAPFSLVEIKAAIFQLGGDKAPGPNGFPLSFYQAFWEVLKDDIFKIFTDLHEGRIHTGPIDYSYICLIPKKEGPTRVSDFQPISLLNGIQKIISKVLANRVAPVLQELVSQSQSTFLKGRNISDAFVTACELIGWSHKRKVEGVGVKVDFKKRMTDSIGPSSEKS